MILVIFRMFCFGWPLQWLLWIFRYVGEKKREALHMGAFESRPPNCGIG